MKKIIRKPYKLAVKIAHKVTNLDKIIAEHHSLKDENHNLRVDIDVMSNRLKYLEKDYEFGWPKGHYYSPVHSIEDLKEYKTVAKRSKGKFTKNITGFVEEKMIKELNSLAPYFKDFDYPMNDDGSSRFYTRNVSFPTLDAVTLFSMIRKNKPKRIIEVGSGFTSGLMMGVNEKYFNNEIDITFMEPYPDLLYQRMRKEDKSRYGVIPKGVQHVPLEFFKKLKKDDILFIDSTHVSKFNSDVNYELFDILPELNKGVIIHFHDVFDGFEYPLKWLKDGWAWNEDYLLRAFLTNNGEYEVLLMNDYLSHHHSELLERSYPKKDKNILNGGSLWLRKV